MDENTQAKFDAKLKELLAVAKKKKNVLEYQEINDFFKDMPLEEEQFERILELLEQNNVDVLRITDDDDDLPDDDLLLGGRRRDGYGKYRSHCAGWCWNRGSCQNVPQGDWKGAAFECR